MERVDGKTALVTGASRGIGRAIAIELAREGAKVAINYSSSDAKAKEVTEEITNLGGTAIFYKANIGSSKEARAMVEQVAKEFGRLDILVNNAGITRDSFAFQNDRRAVGPGDPDESQWVLLLHLGGHPDHDRAKLRSDRQYQLGERPGPGDRAGQLQRQQRRGHRLYPDGRHGAGQFRHHGQRCSARLY